MAVSYTHLDVYKRQIDDFYSGNAEDIKLGALFKEMERYIDQTVRLNIKKMFSAALKVTRVEMSSSEKKQMCIRDRSL